MLTLAEDADYVFDADAADRPVRFIEKYICHYEGAHAGRPFVLHPVQRQIVRDLFGWKCRATGFRRFTELYFEGAVGCGKSPLLAAIGLYLLIADAETGAQLYSLAATYSQARIIFDSAKRFVTGNADLSRRLETTQYEIRHRASGSFWRIVSGKGPGAGCRPHGVLCDEIHEMGGAGAYQSLKDRASKRRQPLILCATNAGTSRTSFCWQLREKAVAALAGTGDPTIYPVIWAAPEDAGTDDPAAWAAANPLIGTTISRAKVAAMAAEAMNDPETDAHFRRLYLSLWPKTAAGRWLDMALWDAAETDDAPPPDAPVYAGLDLSQSDDLCAAVFVAVSPDKFHVRSHFWVPRETAEHYERKDAIPYQQWADAGHITLIDEPTISPDVRRRIAAHVIDAKPTAVCYDRYRADDCIAAMEAAGLTCVPIAQGYTVSPGCHELERRLKEKSVAIAPNPVLRWCASNTETKQDDRGNVWPVKPNAKGRYAGRRSAKIDGISALVTALTQARKHNFPAPKKPTAGAFLL